MLHSLRDLFRATAMLAVVCSSARAQSTPRAFYFGVDAGAAGELAQYNVRSDWGLTLAASAGRQIAKNVAVEVRLGGARFGAPTEFISPGGCFDVQPCTYPLASAVYEVTLGADAVLSPASARVAPLILAGFGARYVKESPELGSETRPYAEFGAGLAIPVGPVRWRVDGRVQEALAATGFPRWMVPITVGVRF